MPDPVKITIELSEYVMLTDKQRCLATLGASVRCPGGRVILRRHTCIFCGSPDWDRGGKCKFPAEMVRENYMENMKDGQDGRTVEKGPGRRRARRVGKKDEEGVGTRKDKDDPVRPSSGAYGTKVPAKRKGKLI